MSLKLAKFTVDGAVLAPMAGYTDIAFRELCAEYGAALTVSEMISVRGIVHGNAATKLLMRRSPAEKLFAIQLFGNNPDDFARAVSGLDCDIIDVNMGCPMPKIVKNGDGSALLKTPELAAKIVSALCNSTDKPITVKTRLGYEQGLITAGELIGAVAGAGAAAVTVHGRYAEQRYSGSSDIEAVRRLAKSSPIPIICNGDLTEPQAEGFEAVAIGRAALSNPAVFANAAIDPVQAAKRHVQKLKNYFDERYAVAQVRKFFVRYFAGVRGGKKLRIAVNSASSIEDVMRTLDVFERGGMTDE